MSIAQLTSTLQKQLAGDTTISKAEMQEWRRLYPYFALPLMLYARQEKQNDRESMALSALYTGDIEDWVGQLGLQQNYANLYPTTQRDASPNTVDTIDLFLHTYSKDEVMDEVLPLENEESNILKTTIHSQENVPATQEEVIAAAKLANADDFITRLPEGYNTMLTSNGANLSQGQRQLISIARAAVADPPVMILDEATSSIDTRTEAIVQRGMDALMKGRTVFVIAHRLSTVRNSDVIMVLDHGEIIERGTHDELIERKGKYYQLYTGAFELE